MKTVITRADSYKTTHWMQLPEGQTYSHSAVTPRKSNTFKTVIPFGIQAHIMKWLLRPISAWDVEIAKRLIDEHMGPGIFNYDGWMRIVNVHGGYMPVRIKAVREGMAVPIGTQIVQIESTDPMLPWLPSYLETGILADVWYPTTVATLSATIKSTIKKYLAKTSDDPDAINFMLHDFGYRGVSSDESGSIGGLAHLINFRGTDTLGALEAAIEYYGATGAVGYSVIASEHSTTCSNSDAENRDDYLAVEKMVSLLEKRVKETGQFQIVSCVADTYDVYRFTREYVGEAFRQRIIDSGGRFVVRPDSGNPETVPVELVEILLSKFGWTTNSKGYKVLPPCVRVLQGDGINMKSIEKILAFAEERKLSAENFVFGVGGALLQGVNRDTLGFAMKADCIIVNGEEKDIYKDPITDAGKKSLGGKHNVVLDLDGEIVNRKASEGLADGELDLMRVVYEGGCLLNPTTFDEVVNLADISF